MQHFKTSHTRADIGGFVVPLPRRHDVRPPGESRSQAVSRFLSLERSLHSSGSFDEFSKVIEYFTLEHAEPVPPTDLQKPPDDVFFLPMHAVRKDCSTTTKAEQCFYASMKTTMGISLNEMHRIALVADISKMYRAIQLPVSDRDLHRFVWRSNPQEPINDFRMTRVTFGVSSSGR